MDQPLPFEIPNVTVLLQPEEQVLEIPRHKVKNVKQLLKYLGEDGVSAYGVLMYVQFVFVAIYIGYSIGCAPIVGFHYGAQNHPELKNMTAHERHPDERLRRCADGAGAGTGCAAGEDLRRVRRGTVHADVPCVRLFSYAFLFAGFNIFASSFFTALGNGRISAAVSFLRTLVFQIAAVLILPAILGIDGIWLAVTAAELAALAVSAAMFVTKDKVFHYRKA